MKKIFGIKVPSKKVLDEEAFRNAAKECGYTELIGVKLHDALVLYANGKSITQAFLCKIPDDEIETIKGIKSAGHKIIDYLKQA